MIKASGLTLRRGVKVLLEKAEFVVHPGERVGVVGKNGAGKSSLFALITKTLDWDTGELTVPVEWRIASVEQEITDYERPAREFVIDGDGHLRTLQKRREALEQSQEINSHSLHTDSQNQDQTQQELEGIQIAELEAALNEAGVWSAPARAEQLLAGLGFTPKEWTQPVGHFSGGWQMRLALARALMAPSDCLLLDEPTNHLDIDAMIWLEKWLSAYQGTVLLISHDTEFLDAVAKTILHVDQAKLVRYKGGYQDFLIQRMERMRQNQFAWERQKQQATHLQSFIDRFRAKASKAKQAQSRIKALGRMQMLAPIQMETGMDIHIPHPENMPDPLLKLEQVTAGYILPEGQHIPILQDLTLTIPAGSRIGILGANGAGKSTLIKTLCGTLAVQAGQRQAARGLTIGYFAQHQLEMLQADATPLIHLSRIAPQTREQVLRNYLGSFGFSGEMATSKIENFSGGEKARLALALIVWQKPNLLLLDEPTNHLDVETRTALTSALAQFSGSMLLVSHDRHLLRTTVDCFWIVADGRVHEFEGDLDDYRVWLNARLSQTSRSGSGSAKVHAQGLTEASASIDRKTQRRLQADQRQRLTQIRKPLEKRSVQIESVIEQTQQAIKKTEMFLADPASYLDTQHSARIAALTEHENQKEKLAALENEWLKIQMALENNGCPTP